MTTSIITLTIINAMIRLNDSRDYDVPREPVVSRDRDQHETECIIEEKRVLTIDCGYISK